MLADSQELEGVRSVGAMKIVLVSATPDCEGTGPSRNRSRKRLSGNELQITRDSYNLSVGSHSQRPLIRCPFPWMRLALKASSMRSRPVPGALLKQVQSP